jgi:hypothetical protein
MKKMKILSILILLEIIFALMILGSGLVVIMFYGNLDAIESLFLQFFAIGLVVVITLSLVVSVRKTM